MELLFDRMPGFTEIARPDEDGCTIITHQHNHAKILSENQEMQKVNTSVRRGDQVWGHHVGRIPMNDYHELQKEWVKSGHSLTEAKEFMAFVLAKLRNSEFSKWRTYGGKI